MKIILLLILLINVNIISQDTMDKINLILNETKAKYAPDKRTVLFDIKFELNDNNLILKGETTKSEALNELIEKLLNDKFNVKNEVEILPSKKLEGKIYGIINLSVANLRTEPKHPAELATQALLGTKVKVLKEYEDWYLVQTPDEYLSWVDNFGIELFNEEEYINWNNSEKLIYSNVYGIVRETTDNNSLPVSDVVAGNILLIINEEENHYFVSFPDGRKGYLNKKELKYYSEWLTSFDFNSEKIIETAKQYMGVPYLWGGTSIKGFDCSGFTKTVFFLNGILLPRDASQQIFVGELVDDKKEFNNLLPGDLVYFGYKATEERKERITHVGIYMGDYKFIHAAGRVKINSFDKNSPLFSEFRYNTYIRSKRILSSINKNGVISLENHESYK